MKFNVHAACGALLALSCCAALAQDPDGPAITQEQTESAVSTLAGPDSADQADLPDGGSPYVAPDTLPRKAYEIHYRASAGTTYDDNIFIQRNHPVDDFITGLTAGATLGLGDVANHADGFLVASYDISPSFFAKDSALNSVDHDVKLNAQWHGSKLTLASFFRFLDLTGSDKDAGDRVNRKLYDGGATALYNYSDKTRVGSEIRFRLSDYSSNFDTTETTGTAWAEYQVTPLISAGGGLTLGYVTVQAGASQTYEQLNGRLSYALAAKVNAALNAGAEYRQVKGADATLTPVFSLSADYSPYELLKLTLQGYRRVQPSIISRRQNTDVTGVSFGGAERFLSKFEINVIGGYENTDYQSESGSLTPSRNEDYFFTTVGLAWLVSEHWKAAASHTFRSNVSTEHDRSFVEDQTTVNISFNY